LDDRKSTAGFCVYLGSNIVSWGSYKQWVVSKSSTEDEYRSIATVLAEITWIMSLLKELHISSVVYSDNLGVVLLVTNFVSHSKSKHFEFDLHFVLKKVGSSSSSF